MQMVLQQNLRIDRDAIAEFCRRNHIRRLSVFGSVLTDRFRPDSDVDVLVEFEPGETPGLRFFGLEVELGEMLRRRIDLNTWGFLHPRMHKRVREASEVLYSAE
jgi:predicted nucleotidyltransferase